MEGIVIIQNNQGNQNNQNNQKKNIAARVAELTAGIADGMGYTLWDVEYVREAGEYYLRITLDKPGGINISDCEQFHRAADVALDEADYIEGAYNLEVSSPGIERELRKPEHFAAFTGQEIEVRLYAPRDGVKVFRGKLIGCEDGCTRILCADGERGFNREEIAKVKTVFDFS